MNLDKRIQQILKENSLKQKDFAKELGVTESYISALINRRNSNISQALATLIEEKYGYSSQWVLDGTGPKLRSSGKNRTLSDIHQRVILQVERLDTDQTRAVLAFIRYLEDTERNHTDQP